MRAFARMLSDDCGAGTVACVAEEGTGRRQRNGGLSVHMGQEAGVRQGATFSEPRPRLARTSRVPGGGSPPAAFGGSFKSSDSLDRHFRECAAFGRLSGGQKGVEELGGASEGGEEDERLVSRPMRGSLGGIRLLGGPLPHLGAARTACERLGTLEARPVRGAG